MLDSEAPASATSRVDQWLTFLRLLGMAGVMGGLGALIAFMIVSEVPRDQPTWQAMVTAMRAVFYSTVFAGILILVPVGAILWRRHRASLRGRRWFCAMMVLLVITIPALHISARLTSHALQHAVETMEFDRAWTLWSRLTNLFIAAFFVFLFVTLIAQMKPRLGQRDASH